MDQDTIILILSSLGIFQAFFLSCYLIASKKEHRKINFFLAMIILGLTIRIGKSILNVHLDLLPWQRNLGISGILLTGPFLWFYGKLLLEKGKLFLNRNYVHVAPFILFVVFCSIIPNTRNRISYIIYIAVFGHLAIYIVLSLLVLVKNKTSIHVQIYSWYRNLIVGVSLLWFFYMGHLFGIFPFYIGGALFFTLLVYIFSFLFLQKHAFRLGKYNTSTLDKSTSTSLMADIKKLFDQDSIYLSNAISLESVAKKLNIPTRQLSQAINENEQKNFSDFVNGYRIEKAKQLLTDPKSKNEKIASIAYDCGFGNVTSFNLAFKAKTQLTPSQYRNQHGSR